MLSPAAHTKMRATSSSSSSTGFPINYGLAYSLVVALLFFVSFYLTTPESPSHIVVGPNNVLLQNNIYNSKLKDKVDGGDRSGGDKIIKSKTDWRKSNVAPVDPSMDPLATKKNFEVIWPAIEPQPTENYPPMSTMLDVILAWNPDIPDVPSTFTETLQHFNYSDPAEREMAARYRDAELPFKVYGVPEVDRVTELWTERYVAGRFKSDRMKPHVEKSKDNHFMFWTGKGNYKGWKPPTELLNWNFDQYLDQVKKAELEQWDNETVHYYLNANGGPGNFIHEDCAFLNAEEENFFITNSDANKGTQCRFGMRGIIAESHYDTGKNMIAMLKGNKRYILNPPTSCPMLGILADSRHPSYRHSYIDFSNVEECRKNNFDKVSAIDTVVREGEVLYVPSFWFHYIISLQWSIQCNARSGAPVGEQGKAFIEKCLNTRINTAAYNAPRGGPFSSKKKNKNKNKIKEPPGVGSFVEKAKSLLS